MTALPSSQISIPLTMALRQAAPKLGNSAALVDWLFLERWEVEPQPGVAQVLRISQIRRANPELAAAIRAELSRPARL